MARPKNNTGSNPKAPRAMASTQSLSAFVKSICDVMRRSNCASALQYVPELTWILFLRILDAQEAREAEQAEEQGTDFSPALRAPWRWQDWAAPWSDHPDHPQTSDGTVARPQGWKRQMLYAAGDGRLFDFINLELLPHLHALDIDRRTGAIVLDEGLLFFTKGRRTERIWYDDLSGLKTGKKTPLTLAHFGFGPDGEVLPDTALPATLTAQGVAETADAGQPFPSYARLLPLRGTPAGDSCWSWTVDFTARRARAQADMQPLLDEAGGVRTVLVGLKEDLRRRKKDKADARRIDALDADIRRQEKTVRDLEAQAAAIDAAVFDLKAVNPHVAAEVDARTPEQIIQAIAAQGQVVADALGRLQALLAH